MTKFAPIRESQVAQVDINYYGVSHGHMERLAHACFVVVGVSIQAWAHNKEVTIDDLDPRDVSVINHTAEAGSLSAYWAEISVQLDTDDWLKAEDGTFTEVKETYDEMARDILLLLTKFVPAGQEFFVWVHGRVTGFAEGVGTYEQSH
jgi:hypothetical protein